MFVRKAHVEQRCQYDARFARLASSSNSTRSMLGVSSLSQRRLTVCVTPALA